MSFTYKEYKTDPRIEPCVTQNFNNNCKPTKNSLNPYSDFKQLLN